MRFPFWALGLRAFSVSYPATLALSARDGHAIVEASVEGDERVDAGWYPARLLVCRIEPLPDGAEPDPGMNFTSLIVAVVDELDAPHGEG
jgi:hypothetical protein